MSTVFFVYCISIFLVELSIVYSFIYLLTYKCLKLDTFVEEPTLEISCAIYAILYAAVFFDLFFTLITNLIFG